MPVTINDADDSPVDIASSTLDDAEVQQIGWAMATRQDAHSSQGDGTAIDVSTLGMSKFGLQVKGTGAAASAWDVRLRVSLDGTNYTDLLQHSSEGGDADGAVKYAPGGAQYPALYFRSRCESVTLGSASDIVVTIVGMP